MSELDRAKILALARANLDGAQKDTHVLQGLHLFFTPGRYRPRNEEAAILEQSRRFTAAQGLACYEWGHGHRTVLLLHGWGGSAAQMTAFVKPLLECGLRVIGIDAPAHGSSPGNQTKLVEIVRCLEILNQEVGPFSAAIGHSLGVSALIRAVGTNILSLEKAVLIAGPGDVPKVFERFSTAMGFSGSIKEEFMRLALEKAEVPPNEIYNAGWRLEPQALIVHDENDLDIPCAEAPMVAGLFQSAIVRVTKGLGHRRVIRSPRVVAEITAFITGVQHDAS